MGEERRGGCTGARGWKVPLTCIKFLPGPRLQSSSGRIALGGPLSPSLNPSCSPDRFLPRLSGVPFHESSSRPKSKPACPIGSGGGLRLIRGRIAGLFSFVSGGGGGPGPLIMRGSRGSSLGGGPRGSCGCWGVPQLSRLSKRPEWSSKQRLQMLYSVAQLLRSLS